MCGQGSRQNTAGSERTPYVGTQGRQPGTGYGMRGGAPIPTPLNLDDANDLQRRAALAFAPALAYIADLMVAMDDTGKDFPKDANKVLAQQSASIMAFVEGTPLVPLLDQYRHIGTNGAGNDSFNTYLRNVAEKYARGEVLQAAV